MPFFGVDRACLRTCCTFFIIWLLSGSVSAAAVGPAATPETPLQGLQHSQWTSRDGAPASIMAMEQTSDGVLWLGSRQGLYLFDGLHFTRVTVVDESSWSPADIYALKSMPNGDMWIGQFSGGAMLLRNGKVTRFREGLPKAGVTQFFLDRHGNFWASTTQGLARFDGKMFHPAGSDLGLPIGTSVTAALDGAGDLVVRTNNFGLFAWSSRSKRFEPVADGRLGYMPLALDAGGRLWESTKDGLLLLGPGNVPSGPLVPWSYSFFSPDIRFDHTGALWVTERGFGVRRVLPMLRGAPLNAAARMQTFHEKDGLTSEQTMSNFVDKDGDIWVGTERGLDRFHAGTVDRIDGPIGSAYLGVQPAGGGSAWLASFTGGAWLRDAAGKITRSSSLPAAVTRITSLTADGKEGLWIASDAGIGLLTASKWTVFQLDPVMVKQTITAMVPDGSGGFWAAVNTVGAMHWDGHGWSRPEGLSHMAITSLAHTGHNLYVGTRDGVLLTYQDETRTQDRQSLTLGPVTVITPSAEGVWVGGEKGIGLWNGQELQVVATQSVPPIYRISGLLLDANRDLWLNTAVGVAHLSRGAVQAVLDGTAMTVSAEVYDASDGVEGLPLRSFLTPTAAALSSGVMIFTTQLGAYAVDPASLSIRAPAPAPYLTSLRADGEALELQTELRPKIHTLEVDYGAAALRDVQRLRFRYRLRGFDKTWQDAGNRREAVFTDLPPGSYTFESEASYDQKTWSPPSAPLPVVIPPSAMQRRSVRAAIFVTALLLTWLLFRWRIAQIYKVAQLRLQERVQERERIARDLHDTLLQGVQGLILRFGAISQGPQLDATLRQKMQQALTLAESVATEGRDRVRDLRSTSADPNELEEILAEAGTLLALSGTATFAWSTRGHKLPLHPLILDEAFCVGREALQNAYQHAGATRISILLEYSPEQLKLTVSDNGKGLGVAAEEASRPGHWGIAGMRERATRIGGQLSIRSDLGRGTDVSLCVPGSIAYPKSTPSRWWDMFSTLKTQELR
ncbi:sensor histidine kinase [Terriglobus roseus]|uniref:Histidine kinase-, DNA gyrase B-, and HSP90-like ATPase n=1 Tax=Terriglobus roseus TaxID=392734 RepID=A0A1H4IZS5_9BACT|nr:sensor histidine kinase [Terriglobus roseus]SEB39574.1 Histidine kinase-, DNA gyrase B-, and HSP90-like ATPase [Terriglobus roseus]